MDDKQQDALEGIEKLVADQRRLIAGQLRITREERTLRELMDAKLEAAGIEELKVGEYLLRRTVRDGKRFVTVTKVAA